VNAVPRVPPEPVDRFAPGTGSELSAELLPVVARVVERAGPGLEALLLSGSHATGEAVWVSFEGRRVSLSDVDLYALMRDEPAAARASASASGIATAAERLAWGLLAPIEVAFVTLASLARWPARPGTVELARSGRVVAGDPAVRARLPRWQPAQVSAEERLLLLENRAFELLSAYFARLPMKATAAARWRAHHAVLKTALDLAAARTLAHGELPAGAEARVARARECGAPEGSPSWLAGAWDGLEPLWREALAWRQGGARAVTDAACAESWRAVARAWCVAWWAEAPRGAGVDPWERALALAARGSLARRVRRSLAFAPRQGPAPGMVDRVRHAAAGTPPQRIHGSAVVLLLAGAQAGGDEPRLPAGALRALRALGVTSAATFADAAQETFTAWDRQLQAGERSAERA